MGAEQVEGLLEPEQWMASGVCGRRAGLGQAPGPRGRPSPSWGPGVDPRTLDHWILPLDPLHVGLCTCLVPSTGGRSSSVVLVGYQVWPCCLAHFLEKVMFAS